MAEYDDGREEIATDVLSSRLRRSQQAAQEALQPVLKAQASLLTALEEASVLGEALRVISTASTSRAPIGWRRLEQLHPRLRELHSELGHAARLLDSNGLLHTAGEPVSADLQTRDTSQDLGKTTTGRTGHLPVERPNGTRDRTRDDLDVIQEAQWFAQAAGGQVRVRMLARQLHDTELGRYSNERSAYASVFAILDRSPLFLRGEPGTFVLVEVADEPQQPHGRAIAQQREATSATSDRQRGRERRRP